MSAEEQQQQQQPADAPVEAPVAPAAPTKPRPRTGPIVWGALILVFCAYTAQQAVAPGSVDTVTWVIAGVIGLGALLLAVGIAVIIRGSRRQ